MSRGSLVLAGIALLLAPTKVAAERSAHPVLGAVHEPVTDPASGELRLEGWACQRGLSASLPVRVYAGASRYVAEASPLSGTWVQARVTYLASSPEVVGACQSVGSPQRFRLAISRVDRQKYQGLKLFVQATRVRGQGPSTALTGSGQIAIPLEPALDQVLLAGTPSFYATPAALGALLSSSPVGSPEWDQLQGLADRLMHPPSGAPSAPAPYFGTSFEQFHKDVEVQLARVPYLGLACRVRSEPAYCDLGIAILTRWATQTAERVPPCASALPSPLHAGVGLSCSAGGNPARDPAIQAGLTLGRYLGHIGESYWLLARNMTPPQRQAVIAWVRELGYVIQKSSLLWNRDLAYEGPNNHLQWHNYGMAVAGLISGDDRLLSFALASAANTSLYKGVTYRRDFLGLTHDSIYEADNRHNLFREQFEPKTTPETGEIWDRYRHQTRHGFEYGLFALTAMTYTGHLAAINGLTFEQQPLLAATDPRSALKAPAIASALSWYAKKLVDSVTRDRGAIRYAPYEGERACDAETNVGAFMVGQAYLTTAAARANARKASSICRAAHGADPFEADRYLRAGIPQLYLTLVTGR